MLIIWGYVIIIVLAGIILIFCGAFLLRLLGVGILLFFLAEIITTVLVFLGYMNFATGWTISKWAFFIGAGIGILQFFRSPSSFFRDTGEIITNLGYGDGNKENRKIEDKEDDEIGFPCCGNCKWNQDRGSYTVRCFQDSSRDKVTNDKCGQWQHY